MSGAACPRFSLYGCREGGNAAVEFALIAPVLLTFLLGIVCYGGYFWLAHNVQQLANDAARAAIGGLTAAERLTLAQSCLKEEIADYGALDPALASIRYAEGGDTFTVSILYDASHSAFFAIAFLPMPSSTIRRTATVRLGGF